ncbi:MAG TPA: type II toxin-antitoxin system RelE/ParE family toxin [Kofleriaceae bacterium]|nr:type II toxin-antitoxin system RelE/ParE family toxin [Kofleriaceae bacterium]
MTKSVTVDDEAVEELESAAQWYEARRRDLGIDFVREVREALRRISSEPQIWPLVPNVPERLGVRRFVLRRFPYAIIFAEFADEIRVLAIAHSKREPGFWRERL